MREEIEQLKETVAQLVSKSLEQEKVIQLQQQINDGQEKRFEDQEKRFEDQEKRIEDQEMSFASRLDVLERQQEEQVTQDKPRGEKNRFF